MAELSVSRKPISALLSVMQGKKFVVPDYQRPYKWDFEKCETLWNDLINFHFEKKDNDDYFLGTIVTCKSGDSENEFEVIDGQQRLTSIFLLLRAFYKILENGDQEDDNIIGLKSQIAPCLWDVDSISKRVKDKSTIHIESRVATETDNDVFHDILKNGEIATEKGNLYSTNYTLFYKMCKEFAAKNPMHWQSLCVTILNKCIVLPIECGNQDTALTIFSTLNDRGLPLSDSDIFKAQIYRTKQTPDDKKEFTRQWKELTEKAENAKISIDDLFRYYSHIIRAVNSDRTKEIGLRKFYAQEKYSKLKKDNLMLDLSNLCEFWLSVNNQEKTTSIYNNDKTAKELEILNDESLKFLHCLNHYPNEYWKYITSVYYYKNGKDTNFIQSFNIFLKKLTSFLFSKFILKPTVNAIKDDIYQGGIDVYNGSPLKFEIDLNDSFKEAMHNSINLKIGRGIILLKAYLHPNQKSLIKSDFEIEHIFPKKWQTANYNGWNKNDADEYLEKYGNKIAIEKKINIQAGNGYFGQKKVKYLPSKISEVVALGNYPSNDWQKEDIEKRETEFMDAILNFFMETLQ